MEGVNPIPQHCSLGARQSTHFPNPKENEGVNGVIFVIKSKHRVLVKTKTLSMFKILPSTWHLCLSIKRFAVTARLQACHLFLITPLNDSIEIKYMQV